MADVPFIRAGYHTLTAHLVIRNAAAALDFYKQAFGATEIMRLMGADQRILHAEMMLAEENEHFRSPHAFSGTTVSLMVYVPDVDAAFDHAIAAGVKVLRPVADQFYGDRAGMLEDPYGHVWTLATHKEDVPPQELESGRRRRFAKVKTGAGRKPEDVLD